MFPAKGKETYGTCYQEENQAVSINEFKKHLEKLWRREMFLKEETQKKNEHLVHLQEDFVANHHFWSLETLVAIT